MSAEKLTKKNKSKKVKPKDIIIIEEKSPKNITLKAKTSSSSNTKKRCKNGTKKYKQLGIGCYTEQEIANHKLTKVKTGEKVKKNKKTRKSVELEIVEPEIVEVFEKRIEPEIVEKKESTKMSLKTPVELEIMEDLQENKNKRYNEEFIDLMDKLSNIMLKQGEPFRARAYQKAQESIMAYPNDILTPEQLKGQPGIGSTIMEKLKEYVETGTLRVLEREKTNPINILGDIYGVGPKKAQELVDLNVKSIDELRVRQNDLLNDIQKVGLKYYEQIQERIPRTEIEEFDKLFKQVFDKADTDSKFEIVGSYRRGAQTSGDIDVIITSRTGDVYKKFVDNLIKTGIILEILSRGSSKTLVIAKLPTINGKERTARRIDFLYAPPDEFAFAILYFTGSKIFNTVMRQYGLNKGYTFNEHGIYRLENKKKGAKVEKEFKTEKDIFDFLGLQFKTPVERVDGRAVTPYTGVGEPVVSLAEPVPTSVKAVAEAEAELEIVPVKKNTTLKKRAPKPTVKPQVQVPVIEAFKPVGHPDVNAILQIIDNFKHNGISVLEQLNETQLNDIIRVSNSKYYNDSPVMTDNQYDIVKEYIEHKFPNNVAVTEIGAEVERNKVKLPYEMASMDKIKPDTGVLTNWISKYKGPYVISCKLDGVSGLYTTEGPTPKLYTRGDGKVGQDISHLIPFLRLPKTKGIVIRGEFIIPKTVFETKYKMKFANPRNMVAGIVNHKHVSDSVVDLHFVAYEVIIPQKKPSEQMNFLGTINVEHVLFETVNTISNEFLSQLLVEWRKTYMYEIDGIIVTDDKIYPRKSGNPDHAFAFKMVLSDQIAEAKVVDVIWTPSKDGYLKPRVQIEPINLGGVTIEFATGFNGAFIKDNKIGIGATIEIIRSGDVIPHIKAVTVQAEEPKMPSVPFKWNDTHVDIMLENASEDPTVKEKNITGFFRGLGVEGLSSGNINRLINTGYDTVPEIIKMSEQDFLNVDGFKGKMANKIYTGIRDKLTEASIITLMAASNIFGRGFSEKKMELILNEIPDILVSDISNDKKISDVASVKGMATKTAESFVNKIQDFKDFLDDCGLEDKLYEKTVKKNIDNNHPLFGKTVVLTGTRDKDVIEFLKNVGANQGSSISKNTFLVITKNKDEDTGKAEEARKLNIPIMSIQEFTTAYLVNQ
jgi:DNA ligase (NAD+)